MFTFLKSALSKTSSFFSKKLFSLFSTPFDETSKGVLEEILYEADLGSLVVEYFLEEISSFARKNPKTLKEGYLFELERIALTILEKKIPPLGKEGAPKVILVVGVNGSGKTTSIAKLAHYYKENGKKVLLACGDTFRAAATYQLELHAKNLDIDIVLAKHGADPSSVIYDAINKGKHGQYDVVICDSAGRLESKTELLEELKKIATVAKKLDPNAPHEVFLTIDAGLGSASIAQVERFQKYIPLTGLILTKIDSTSKGGIALSIYKKYAIPIVYVAFGETVCDFSPFDARSYAKALFKE
jgi:fused signal recognition particle receptor